MSLPAWLASGPTGGPGSEMPKGAGERLPVVLLHGMGSTAAVWLPQLEHFGRSRYTLAWTLPGYGTSPPPAGGLGWDTLVDTLAALCDAHALPRLHLLGHSIGGMVAQAFARRHRGRLASLVLSASSAGFGQASAAWKADFLRQREEPLAQHPTFAEAAPALLERFCAPCIRPEMRALAVHAAASIEKPAYLEAMRLLLSFDGAADLAQLDLPVLLVAGSDDQQAPLKAQQRLLERLPQGRLVVLDSLNHMANLEAPVRFNACIEAFLQEVEAAAAVRHACHPSPGP